MGTLYAGAANPCEIASMVGSVSGTWQAREEAEQQSGQGKGMEWDSGGARSEVMADLPKRLTPLLCTCSTNRNVFGCLDRAADRPWLPSLRPAAGSALESPTLLSSRQAPELGFRTRLG